MMSGRLLSTEPTVLPSNASSTSAQGGTAATPPENSNKTGARFGTDRSGATVGDPLESIYRSRNCFYQTLARRRIAPQVPLI